MPPIDAPVNRLRTASRGKNDRTSRGRVRFWGGKRNWGRMGREKLQQIDSVSRATVRTCDMFASRHYFNARLPAIFSFHWKVVGLKRRERKPYAHNFFLATEISCLLHKLLSALRKRAVTGSKCFYIRRLLQLGSPSRLGFHIVGGPISISEHRKDEPAHESGFLIAPLDPNGLDCGKW